MEKTGGAIPLFSEADSMRIHDDDLRWSYICHQRK
jgi:hypothetical protein